jgi:tetratricopeptide (TPR) repeat protein
MGLLDEAVSSARRSLLLAPDNYDSEYVLLTSLYAAGKRQQAQAELEKLRLRTPSDFTPVYSWDEPFPQSVVDMVTEVDLAEMRYNQGLAEVLRVLGW